MKVKLTEAFKTRLKEDGDMTYSQSAKGVKIDRQRAEQELQKHGHMEGSEDWKEWTEWANKQQWPMDASKVFDWLGY